MQTPRTEFAQALKAIANERGLDPSVIIETIKEAIIAAYKRDAREQGEDVEEEVFTVQIDPRDGGAKIFQDKKMLLLPVLEELRHKPQNRLYIKKIREAEKEQLWMSFREGSELNFRNGFKI